jgi:hypothetical protein
VRKALGLTATPAQAQPAAAQAAPSTGARVTTMPTATDAVKAPIVAARR